MPKRHKNHKGCSRCGHCRAWRVNRAFVRTTKAHGTEFLQYTTCNRCSRLYRKDGPLSKEDFREQYRGSDHTDSDPEDDDGEEDGNDNPQPKDDDNYDQGGSSAQGGMGHAVTVA